MKKKKDQKFLAHLKKCYATKGCVWGPAGAISSVPLPATLMTHKWLRMSKEAFLVLSYLVSKVVNNVGCENYHQWGVKCSIRELERHLKMKPAVQARAFDELEVTTLVKRICPGFPARRHCKVDFDALEDFAFDGGIDTFDPPEWEGGS